MATADGALSGRTVLVTGASSGLGAHFARIAARAGARVIVAARRAERLAALAAELGPDARALPLDVADPGSIAACFGAAGPVDVLVNNAGVADTRAALLTDAAAFDRVLDTNLRGAFLVARAAAEGMLAAGRGGAIVNVASILGLRVATGVLAYTVSKAGVVQMTQALALEWARHGIRVNALAPGYFETEMTADTIARVGEAEMARRVPLRRLGRPDDLDGPFLLLATDAGRYLTGVVLPVDGGHLVSSL
jgi:NAD(P)-dependent dehydrogenase (short-subunit alcohol dehydrogenase family)